MQSVWSDDEETSWPQNESEWSITRRHLVIGVGRPAPVGRGRTLDGTIVLLTRVVGASASARTKHWRSVSRERKQGLGSRAIRRWARRASFITDGAGRVAGRIAGRIAGRVAGRVVNATGGVGATGIEIGSSPLVQAQDLFFQLSPGGV